MKLPLDFGLKLFFRLLLPGFFLTLGLLPALFAILDVAGLKGQREAAFVIAIIIAGWLFVAADMPVYMLLEGRRFWPAGLLRWGTKREQERLDGALQKIANYYAKGQNASDEDRRQWLEASVEARKFPVNANGEWCAEYSTRLGNTITAFEKYSRTRYGIDSIFYWPRIWINLGKDLREEVDSQQAMADSAVYSTVALGAAGLLWIGYALANVMQDAARPVLLEGGVLRKPLPDGIFAYVPGLPACLFVGAIFLLFARRVYHLSVYLNDQFGGVFTAIIDSHASKLATDYVPIEKIVDRVSKVTGVQVPDGEKMEVAGRYLQYFTARLPGRPRAVPIPQVADVLAGVEPRYTCKTTQQSGPSAPPAPRPHLPKS